MPAAAPRQELLSFLGAIKAEPEEDTPKLALADWLQEQPDEADRARGEFLRQFVRNGQLARNDPAREDFGALVLLWNRYEREWARRLKSAGFAVWATRHMFRWGLLFPAFEWNGSAVQAKAAKELAATEEYAWVAGIAVRPADARAGISFVESPLFGSLVGLRIAEAEGSAALLGQLCASPREKQLQSLEIGFSSYGSGTPIYTLSQSGHLTALRQLTLSRSAVDEFRYLCDAPHLNALQVLDLRGAGLPIQAGHAFAQSRGLPALVELNLGPGPNYCFNRLGSAGLRDLVAGERSGRLRRLNLASNGIADMGVEALCAEPHMCNLTHLDLSDNRLTSRAAGALAGAAHLKTLEHLTLTGNAIAANGAMALANSPHLTNLRRLDLSGKQRLGAKVLKALRDRFGAGVIVH